MKYNNRNVLASKSNKALCHLNLVAVHPSEPVIFLAASLTFSQVDVDKVFKVPDNNDGGIIYRKECA